jgi:hypothetical protein
VLLLAEGAEPLHLTAPAAPVRASIAALGHGGSALVLWLGPRRCGGRQRVLHASVIANGKPVGPVTRMGDADDYALAVRGADADLWLLDDGVVTYLPMRCEPPG